MKPMLIITEEDGERQCWECVACAARSFPTIEKNGRDRNNLLLEGSFQVHVKAEHSNGASRNLQPGQVHMMPSDLPELPERVLKMLQNKDAPEQ